MKSLARNLEIMRCRKIFKNLETAPWIKWLQRCLGNNCFYNKFVLMESDTLGNVQKKVSNTIFPHCFCTWCRIRIIVKATHLCDCVIHQHTFKCIWVEKHNNLYHMTMIIIWFISVFWHKCISVFIIIRYIRCGCVFLRSINKV